MHSAHARGMVGIDGPRDEKCPTCAFDADEKTLPDRSGEDSDPTAIALSGQMIWLPILNGS